MPEPTDEELVRSFLKGDRDSFATLVERHERRIYNLSYRMLGNTEEARDAVQDVFLTCLRKLGGFRGASSFGTWLHRVTVNTCYDALRRRSRERPGEIEEAEAQPREPGPDLAESASLAVDVQRALVRVPQEFRVVLVMHDVQGIPYEEIAEALGAPVGTVKSRLHRGRLALARAMGGPGGVAGPGDHGSGPSGQRTPRDDRGPGGVAGPGDHGSGPSGQRTPRDEEGSDGEHPEGSGPSNLQETRE